MSSRGSFSGGKAARTWGRPPSSSSEAKNEWSHTFTPICLRAFLERHEICLHKFRLTLNKLVYNDLFVLCGINLFLVLLLCCFEDGLWHSTAYLWLLQHSCFFYTCCVTSNEGSSSKDGRKTWCIAVHCYGIHVGLLWIKATGLVLAVQLGQDTYRSPIEDDARVPDTYSRLLVQKRMNSTSGYWGWNILKEGKIRRREVSSETSMFNALRSINGTLVTVFEWNGMSIRCYHSGKPIPWIHCMWKRLKPQRVCNLHWYAC